MCSNHFHRLHIEFVALLISFMSSVFLILDVALIHSASQDDGARGGIYWPKKFIFICGERLCILSILFSMFDGEQQQHKIDYSANQIFKYVG